MALRDGGGSVHRYSTGVRVMMAVVAETVDVVVMGVSMAVQTVLVIGIAEVVSWGSRLCFKGGRLVSLVDG